MSQKIGIINFGPEPVKIEVQGREEGRFTEKEEFLIPPESVSTVAVNAQTSAQIILVPTKPPV